VVHCVHSRPQYILFGTDRNTEYTVLAVGFPFKVKKLFTRNIVTDVTDGDNVGITVVTT
jgi:hypothetical protein